MLQITESDIIRAERILLPLGCGFNEERRAFIQCMQSRDVVACPGSGKTTALLAKLLILASYMPFADGRGVCVLTHTNVAVEAIKKRAGGAADLLFAHPNYFGTIQGFVNRFFAIPFYRMKYKSPVHSIDNERFCTEIEKQYNLDRGLKSWMEHHHGTATTLAEYWLKSADLKVGVNLENDISGLARKTKTYCSIERIRQDLLDRGILSFNDAYSLALYYLTYYPCVIEAIRQRFRFVFIDEMQDTDDHQLRVLDKLFTNDNSVILQRLGDPNQAIFRSNVKQEMLWSPTNPMLPFSDSLRYGESIAKVLDTVRVDRRLTLVPNPKRGSLSPHILLFEPGAEGNVLPAFGEIIREYKLHELTFPKFSAVGWIGKDKTEEGKPCLRSYYKEYQNTLKNYSQWCSTFLSYAEKTKLSLRDSPENAAMAIDIAFSGIIQGLRVGKLKDPKTQRLFTTSTYQAYLKQSNPQLYTAFHETLADLVLLLCQEKINTKKMRDSIWMFLHKNVFTNQSSELADFFKSDTCDFLPPQHNQSNTFVTATEDQIEIGTVHSVKGETHTATLYLETFYHGFDSSRLLPFCLGQYPITESKKVYHRENLKIAHVAFSRPTHLLAFACSKTHVTSNEQALKEAGWVVREIS